jgi:hypothetical protein
MLSFLIFAVVVLLVAGIILWGIEQIVPATWPFRNAVRALIIGGVLIWLIVTAYQKFGQ